MRTAVDPGADEAQPRTRIRRVNRQRYWQAGMHAYTIEYSVIAQRSLPSSFHALSPVFRPLPRNWTRRGMRTTSIVLVAVPSSGTPVQCNLTVGRRELQFTLFYRLLPSPSRNLRREKSFIRNLLRKSREPGWGTNDLCACWFLSDRERDPNGGLTKKAPGALRQRLWVNPYGCDPRGPDARNLLLDPAPIEPASH